jgi:ABC-type bacteriocin/lantibiotic exporter with double-glycine peptidase domain
VESQSTLFRDEALAYYLRGSRTQGDVLQAGVFLLSYRRDQEYMSQDLQTQARAQSYLVHMLAGIETLKASGCEDRAVEHWSHLFVDQLMWRSSAGV